MYLVYLTFFTSLVILVFGLAEILLLRWLNQSWWVKKPVRRAAYGLPVIGVLMIITWGAGEYYTLNWLAYPGAILAMTTFVLEVSLMLSLPLSGLIHLFNRLLDCLVHKARRTNDVPTDTKRRDFIKTAAAALPVASLTLGVSGMASAMGSVKVHLRPIAFDNLPDDLNGLRILHLSDLHLRHYFTLSDLESTLTEIEPHHPDLVVITGDIADDLRLLGDCIKLIDQLNPRLGTFACLGNHEYFRGPAEVHRTFAASPVPLFVNQATTVSVGKTEVLIGGIDDPRRMGAKETEFFQRSIDKTLDGLPTTPFSILMSHRPDALDYASVVGIDLTLAGHTHGGQLGLAGQSALESIWPDRYLWGHYQKSKSHLYTSSGMGHWFPFRLGCPAEAPIIELTKV